VIVRYVDAEEIAKIKSETGIDVTERYRHVVDKSGINHALKMHGDPKKEAPRGQIAITQADLERIPEIIETPDSIKRGDDTKSGLKSIVYSKAFNGDTIYVEEVRTGREELAFATMYKMKRKSGQMNKPPTPTSETTLASDNDSTKKGGGSRNLGFVLPKEAPETTSLR
jgi:hypothetical protein